jgi:hypothetical protein
VNLQEIGNHGVGVALEGENLIARGDDVSGDAFSSSSPSGRAAAAAASGTTGSSDICTSRTLDFTAFVKIQR